MIDIPGNLVDIDVCYENLPELNTTCLSISHGFVYCRLNKKPAKTKDKAKKEVGKGHFAQKKWKSTVPIKEAFDIINKCLVYQVENMDASGSVIKDPLPNSDVENLSSVINNDVNDRLVVNR